MLYQTVLRQLPYAAPLLWAIYISWLIFAILDWKEERGKPYRQVLYTTGAGGMGKAGLKDRRGLVRAVRMMDRGARFVHIKQSYWDRLDRSLSLMGEKTGARETVTILLLRSMLVALPVLVTPLFWEGWWKAGLYPLAAAILFKQEMRKLERRYSLWQKSLIRDIPEVMDRLRICFAGGRDYLSALRQAQASGGLAMAQALDQLIHDIQTIGSASAFRLFSVSFDMPAIQKLASALMLAVESGYGAAEAYFNSIEGELAALRQEAAESLVHTKPEKVYQLYTLLFCLAVASLLLKGWEILQQVGQLFGA